MGEAIREVTRASFSNLNGHTHSPGYCKMWIRIEQVWFGARNPISDKLPGHTSAPHLQTLLRSKGEGHEGIWILF